VQKAGMFSFPVANIWFVVAAFVTAFSLAFIAIPSIIVIARRKNLMDEPGGRKIHAAKIPNLGGIAIWAAFLLSFSLWAPGNLFPEFQYLVAALVILFFVGIKDDIQIIAPTTKLIGQILALAVLVVFGQFYITNLHGFSDIRQIPFWIGMPVSLFAMLVIINGINLIDGIDGLASGIGIVTASAYGIWFYLAGYLAYAILAFALIGSLCAFFHYNVYSKENKIFMGETGALTIGLIIGLFTIKFNEFNIVDSLPMHVNSAPSVSFGILVLPLFDVLRVMFIRIIINRGVFEADKNHIHHKMLQIGLSHAKATYILLLVNALFIGLVFFLSQYVSIRRLMLIILVLAVYFSYIPSVILIYREKKLKKTDKDDDK
jgi:UDP-GlcNAc:undecaprenyl-phosphate/decaprenyl-phosphate GlcNAc-1-phosphate transferase